MSFFISSMAARRLDVEAAGVERQTPLPTSVTFGASSGSPQRRSIDPRRARRGAPDRVDQRKVLPRAIRRPLTAIDPGGAEPSRRGARAASAQLGRTHVVRRRVDQVARQRGTPSAMRG
jgi:hypothetical protein